MYWFLYNMKYLYFIISSIIIFTKIREFDGLEK